MNKTKAITIKMRIFGPRRASPQYCMGEKSFLEEESIMTQNTIYGFFEKIVAGEPG